MICCWRICFVCTVIVICVHVHVFCLTCFSSVSECVMGFVWLVLRACVCVCVCVCVWCAFMFVMVFVWLSAMFVSSYEGFSRLTALCSVGLFSPEMGFCMWSYGRASCHIKTTHWAWTVVWHPTPTWAHLRWVTLQHLHTYSQYEATPPWKKLDRNLPSCKSTIFSPF